MKGKPVLPVPFTFKVALAKPMPALVDSASSGGFGVRQRDITPAANRSCLTPHPHPSTASPPPQPPPPDGSRPLEAGQSSNTLRARAGYLVGPVGVGGVLAVVSAFPKRDGPLRRAGLRCELRRSAAEARPRPQAARRLARANMAVLQTKSSAPECCSTVVRVNPCRACESLIGLGRPSPPPGERSPILPTRYSRD